MDQRQPGDRIMTAAAETLTPDAAYEQLAQRNAELEIEKATLAEELEHVQGQRDAALRDRDYARGLIHAVVREIPHLSHRASNGNGPGHSHSRPGIWDSNNGEIAGKACSWCAIWRAAEKIARELEEATP